MAKGLTSTLPALPPTAIFDIAALKERLESGTSETCEKTLAYLSGYMTPKDVANRAGVTVTQVHTAIRLHPEVVDKAEASRAEVTIALCEKKALAIIESMEAKNIPAQHLARAAKNLLEATVIAGRKTNKNDESDVDSLELILKIKKRMKPAELKSIANTAIASSGEILDAEVVSG